jgi:hypothetical protein
VRVSVSQRRVRILKFTIVTVLFSTTGYYYYYYCVGESENLKKQKYMVKTENWSRFEWTAALTTESSAEKGSGSRVDLRTCRGGAITAAASAAAAVAALSMIFRVAASDCDRNLDALLSHAQRAIEWEVLLLVLQSSTTTSKMICCTQLIPIPMPLNLRMNPSFPPELFGLAEHTTDTYPYSLRSLDLSLDRAPCAS